MSLSEFPFVKVLRAEVQPVSSPYSPSSSSSVFVSMLVLSSSSCVYADMWAWPWRTTGRRWCWAAALTALWLKGAWPSEWGASVGSQSPQRQAVSLNLPWRQHVMFACMVWTMHLSRQHVGSLKRRYCATSVEIWLKSLLIARIFLQAAW